MPVTANSFLDSCQQYVKTEVAEHLRGLWRPTGETQVLLVDGTKLRVPKAGNTEPHFYDHSYTFGPEQVQALGVSGWDYEDGRSYFVTIDLDALDHAEGQDHSEVIRLAKLIEQAEIMKSKGGEGHHLRFYFDPDNAPIAYTRDDHIQTGQKVLQWLSNQISINLKAEKLSDAVGVIGWIAHRDAKPGGFELLKKSHSFMPVTWDDGIEVVAIAKLRKPHVPLNLTKRQEQIIAWLGDRGRFVEGRLQTHTFYLRCAQQDKDLKVRGWFNTISEGTDLSTGNCFLYPQVDGSWKVFRHTKGTPEHESWWVSTEGWTTCFFDKDKCKQDHSLVMFLAAKKADEFFHDERGQAYVVTQIHNVKETLAVTDPRYRAKLRIGFRKRYGEITSGGAVDNALDELSAMALNERPEMQTAIRIAEHGGRLYVDLADRERRIVEIYGGGWKVIDAAPVRFMRPFGMLPLPEPLPDGTIDEFRALFNVGDDEVPLLLAFVVGCSHPTGPYAHLAIIGEHGTAKTSAMRLIHDFTDPNLVQGATLPKDARDLLAAAQQRRLISFDNPSKLTRDQSDLLCMLVTGAATANRKLFTDDGTALMRAKRPVITTSIASIVTQPDLADRTLTVNCPVIPASQRKSEFALTQDLRRSGVRGRMFGVILDGVAAAFAGHANVKRDDMPRLADLFSWITAAESTLGIETGSAIKAINRQADEEATYSLDDPFIRDIIPLCSQGFHDSPTELAKRLGTVYTSKGAGNKVREYAPSLRKLGYTVDWRKSNGVRKIKLGKAVA
jgi:hypothetical protein